MIVPVQVVNTPRDIYHIQHSLLGWKMYPANKECRRRNPCCWCMYLWSNAFEMRLHPHKCNRVGKRFEHRLMYTTLVVRRCSWSIRCPSCPIHWGSRRSWFCQRHLGVSQRHILYTHLLWSFLLLGNTFRQNKHCNELRWVHQ